MTIYQHIHSAKDCCITVVYVSKSQLQQVSAAWMAMIGPAVLQLLTPPSTIALLGHLTSMHFR